MTSLTQLSPAAQAVLDATYNTYNPADPFVLRHCVAAALRTAVHQLNKKRWEPGVHWARMELLTIADELENQ